MEIFFWNKNGRLLEVQAACRQSDDPAVVEWQRFKSAYCDFYHYGKLFKATDLKRWNVYTDLDEDALFLLNRRENNIPTVEAREAIGNALLDLAVAAMDDRYTVSLLIGDKWVDHGESFGCRSKAHKAGMLTKALNDAKCYRVVDEYEKQYSPSYYDSSDFMKALLSRVVGATAVPSFSDGKELAPPPLRSGRLYWKAPVYERVYDSAAWTGRPSNDKDKAGGFTQWIKNQLERS